MEDKPTTATIDGEVVDEATGEIQEAKPTTLVKKTNVRDLTDEEIGAAEAALLSNNYALLSPAQRVFVIQKKCEAIGVNFFLQPFTWGTIDKKLVPIPNKGLYQQLRAVRGLKVLSVEEDWSKAESHGIVVIRMEGAVGDRTDRDIGVVGVGGLKGEALANELMAGYTKAHNRLTATLCGGDSGPSDAEVPTIPGAYIGEEKPAGIKTMVPGAPGERSRVSFTQVPIPSSAPRAANGAAAPPPVPIEEAGEKLQPQETVVADLLGSKVPLPVPPVGHSPTPAPIKIGTTKPKIMKAT